MRLRQKFMLGYLALPLLVPAGAAFSMLEIVIRMRFKVIVILNLATSFLQIQSDPLKFGSPLRPHLFVLYYTIIFCSEQEFLRFLFKFWSKFAFTYIHRKYTKKWFENG